MAESTTLLRRYTFKLYPNTTQAAELDRQRVMHCRLYNGLLQQRIEAYSRQRKSLTYFDQCKEITALRADDEDYRALSRSSMDATAQRLDRAYQAFFRRAKAGAGAQSGFPRFRASALYPSIPFKIEKSGWSFDLRGANTSGHRLRVQGINGKIRARGKLPGPALERRSCEILWRDGAWWLSLVVAMEPRRKAGTEKGRVELDLIDSFAAVRDANGERLAGLEDPFGDKRRNPYCSESVAGEPPESLGKRGDATGHLPVLAVAPGPESLGKRGDATGPRRAPAELSLPESLGKRGDATGRIGVAIAMVAPKSPSEGHDATGYRIARLQQRIAGCRRGSLRHRRLSALKRRIEARDSRRRREQLHAWTTKLQRHFGEVDVIAPPSLKDATASGHGDERDWGAAVEPKAKLNRRVLDQAPASAVQMIEYKFAEAGGTARVERVESHPVLVGNELRTVAKEARRSRRKLKKEAA